MLTIRNGVDAPWMHFLRNAPDDGSGGDDGQGQGSDATTEQDKGGESKSEKIDIEKLIAEAIAKEVGGLKKKNNELLGKLKEAEKQAAEAKTKALSDEDFEKFKTLQERIERDELLKALAEGKSEEALEKITRRTKVEYEAKVAAEAAEKAKLSAEAAELRAQLERTKIDAVLSKASAEANVKPQYQDLLARLVADKVKVVDGDVVVVDKDGSVAMNAAGTAPLRVADFVDSMRKEYADLFIPASGGGASGSGSKGAQGNKQAVAYDIVANLSMEEFIARRAKGEIR